jgi:hypothetical protein
MSDLTRNHLLPCERCGRPCDGFILHSFHHSESAVTVVQFCTYHCAAEYHKVTGFRVWRQEEKSSAVRGPTVIEPGLPLYRKEVQTLEESWLDFDKPLTSLVYPPKGKKVDKDYIRLGTLPCYYTVGKMSSRPLAFPTKREAEQVANLIPSSVIQKDAND